MGEEIIIFNFDILINVVIIIMVTKVINKVVVVVNFIAKVEVTLVIEISYLKISDAIWTPILTGYDNFVKWLKVSILMKNKIIDSSYHRIIE